MLFRSDARQARLSITDTGRALHQEIAERLRLQQEAVLSPLNAKERATLVTLLSKVVGGQPSVGAAEL